MVLEGGSLGGHHQYHHGSGELRGQRYRNQLGVLGLGPGSDTGIVIGGLGTGCVGAGRPGGYWLGSAPKSEVVEKELASESSHCRNQRRVC